MRETLRLSDAPRFHRILMDFALRLDNTLNDENVVLSQVRTVLKYHDGREFFYTLDPSNFRVELYDELVSEISPVNGFRIGRKVVYSIRDIDGDWHGPIGTIAIFKDILGLDPRGSNALEKALVAVAHEDKQRQLLQKNGDDLRGYGRDNHVQEELLTQAYLDSLRDTDPLHQHLQRLLRSRIPLDREGLRLLRAASRRFTPAQIRIAQATPVVPSQPSLEREQPTPVELRPSYVQPRPDNGQRTLSQAIVENLRPQALLLYDALPAHLHTALTEVFESQTEYVPCTKELLAALREVTGEFLTTSELEKRHICKASGTELPITQIFSFWTAVIAELEEPLSPLQGARLRYHLEQKQLTVCEISSLRAACRKLKIQGVLPEKAVADEAQLGESDQRRWYERRALLRLHLQSEQLRLYERIEGLQLRWSDLPALEKLWQAVQGAELPYHRITALRIRSEFFKAIPPHLQNDFKLAVQYNTFPPHLRDALNKAAEQLELDVQTLAPPELPSGGRNTLLRGWHHVAPLLGEDAPQLLTALKAGRYTLAQAKQLKQLLGTPLSQTIVSNEDRKYLLQRQSWKEMYPRQDYIYLRAALEKRNYTLRCINLLDGLVERVKDYERRDREKAARKAAQEEAERQRQIVKAQREEQRRIEQAARRQEQASQELHQRLLLRWRALKPSYVKLLQTVSPNDLLRDLPSICQEFQKNNSSISLSIESAVCSYLDGLRATS